jgi:hypothetical protein
MIQTPKEGWLSTILARSMAGKRTPKVTWGQAVAAAKEKAANPAKPVVAEIIPDPYPLGCCQKCGNGKAFRHYFEDGQMHRKCRLCEDSIII